ncbi:MAG TPA: carotenoid oxygenase family protein [Pseudonocardiaceae bacterium]
MPGKISPFLEGSYRPVYSERTVQELTVTGRIPDELDGLFTQIGGNPLAPPRKRDADRYAWFSQDGMICGIRLRDGKAEWFRNRWIRSRRVCRAYGEQRPAGPRRFFSDVVNTNVVCHGGMFLALVETGCVPARLTTDLETAEYTDLGGGLPRGFAAHPKIDPVSGELFALGYSPLRTYADYLVISPDGTVRKTERIPLHGRPMIHDIAITNRYVLFFDLPPSFELGAAMRGRFPWRWQDKRPARLGVLPKEGSALNIRWFPISPCFLFHTINAYEENGLIRVFGVRYPKMFDGKSEDPFEGSGGVPWEWTVDLATGGLTERQLDDRHQELPRMAPGRLGRLARHYYSLGGGGRSHLTNEPEAVLKYDLRSGQAEEHRYPTGSVPTEPVFVPKAGAVGEDDGWLVHLLLDPGCGGSELVVLDAGDVTGAPVATVRLPMRVPFGFHSQWIPAKDLAAVDAAFTAMPSAS